MQRNRGDRVETWRRISATVLGLTLGASCHRGADKVADSGDPGTRTAALSIPLECRGVAGYCFVLSPDPSSASQSPVAGTLEVEVPDHLQPPFPYPYFKCSASECDFDLNSRDVTGVFKEGVEGSLRIDRLSPNLANGTKWGWCSVSNSGDWQGNSHTVGPVPAGATLSFPAQDGRTTTYRFRIWAAEGGPDAVRSIAGDPKIKAVGTSHDPTATFPPPIPVCPAEYQHYEYCLPGQYDHSKCPILSSPKYSSYNGVEFDPANPPNVTSSFWLYRTSTAENTVDAANLVRIGLDDYEDHYGPNSQFNPLEAKLALANANGEATNIVFYYVTTLANYSTTVIQAPTLPAVGTANGDIQWRSVSYSAVGQHSAVFESTTAFLDCLSGTQPTMAAYSEVAAGQYGGDEFTVSVLFPYPVTDNGNEYETCACASPQAGTTVSCDGASCETCLAAAMGQSLQ